MSAAWFLYLADLVSNVDVILSIFITLYSVFFILACFFYVMDKGYEKDKDTIDSFNFVCSKLWLFALVVTISILLPSKSTMYLMAGSSYLERSNVPAKVQEALELKLDDVIKSLKDKK